MTAPRNLPQPDEFVAAVLRDALSSAVTVHSVPTSDVYGRTPFVQVAGTSTGDTPHWPLLDAPVVDVDCWAAPTKAAAWTLSELCRAALFSVAHTPHSIAGGTIAHVRQVSYPTERRLTGQPGGIFHYAATYQLVIRPTPIASVS